MSADRQNCEGCEWKGMPNRPRYCVSEAHWRVKLEGFTVYLCTQCHTYAELELAANAVPRDMQYREVGFPLQPGHEDATRRHDLVFAHVGKPPPARQGVLDFNDSMAQ